MEISHGCRKAERAAESMDVGQLIGHLIHCAQRLAKYAEAIEEERDPEMAKCQIVGHPVYIEAALMHLAIAPRRRLRSASARKSMRCT